MPVRTSTIAKFAGSAAAHPGFRGALADLRSRSRPVGHGKRGCPGSTENPCEVSGTPHRALCALTKGHAGGHLNADVTCERINHARHRR